MIEGFIFQEGYHWRWKIARDGDIYLDGGNYTERLQASIGLFKALSLQWEDDEGGRCWECKEVFQLPAYFCLDERHFYVMAQCPDHNRGAWAALQDKENRP